jgi:hypothetical protein
MHHVQFHYCDASSWFFAAMNNQRSLVERSRPIEANAEANALSAHISNGNKTLALADITAQ